MSPVFFWGGEREWGDLFFFFKQNFECYFFPCWLSLQFKLLEMTSGLQKCKIVQTTLMKFTCTASTFWIFRICFHMWSCSSVAECPALWSGERMYHLFYYRYCFCPWSVWKSVAYITYPLCPWKPRAKVLVHNIGTVMEPGRFNVDRVFCVLSVYQFIGWSGHFLKEANMLFELLALVCERLCNFSRYKGQIFNLSDSVLTLED